MTSQHPGSRRVFDPEHIAEAYELLDRRIPDGSFEAFVIATRAKVSSSEVLAMATELGFDFTVDDPKFTGSQAGLIIRKIYDLEEPSVSTP